MQNPNALKMKRPYLLLVCLTMVTALFGQNDLSSFSCAHAIHLDCDEGYWFSAPQSDHLNGINYDFSDCGYVSGAYSGKDALYTIDVGTEARRVTINLSGMWANLDLFVFRKCTDHYNAVTLKDCVGISNATGYHEEEVIIENATGVYYLVVDAPDAGYSSDYLLSIECDADRPICEEIPEIFCGQKVYGSNSSYDPGTTSLLDEHKHCYGGYTSYEGNERIYKLSAHYGDLYDITIDLTSQGYGVGHDMFLYTRCDAFKDYKGKWHYSFSGELDYCHHQYNAQSKRESAFVEHLAAYKTLYIVVEGSPGHYGQYSEGNFDLVVSCGNPCGQKKIELECNTTVHGNTAGRKNKASYYACEDYDDKGHNWGPEMTYYFDVEEKTDIRIELYPESKADLNLYLLGSCDQDQCLSFSKTHGKGKSEIIEYRLWPGRYYVVVEGYRGDAGPFNLKLGGCNCYSNEAIYCGDPVYGTTENGTHIVNALKDACFSLSSAPVDLSGPERIYSFQAMESREYVFSLSELEKDVNLYLIDNCRDINSCRGFSTKGWLEDEHVTIYLEAYEEILILIDSRSELLKSSFRLDVRCTDEIPEEEEEEEETDDPVDDEPDDCITVLSSDPVSIRFDVQAIYDTLCPADLQNLKVYIVTDDVVDSSSVRSLTIIDGQAEMNREISADSLTYRAVFSKHADSIAVACSVDFEVGPLLGCGLSYSGSTLDGQSHFDKSDIELCYASKSLFDGPDEIVPFVKTSADEVMNITLFQNTDNLSLFILDSHLEVVRYPCKGQNFTGGGMIGNTGAVGEFISDREDPLPAGLYYALIEGFAKHIADDYTLFLSCGSSCGEASEVSCGDSFDDTNEEAPSLMDNYLIGSDLRVGYSGPERIYTFTLGDQTEVDIRLEDMQGLNGDMPDLDFFLYEGVCADQNLIVASTLAGDEDENIVRILEAGVYTLIVDGWRGSTGSFTLSIYGCDTGAFVPDLPVTVSKSKNRVEARPEVYPNPFSRMLNIRLANDSSKSHVEIFGPDGRKVYDAYSESPYITMDADKIGLGYGIFYYRISSAHDTSTGKIIRIQ